MKTRFFLFAILAIITFSANAQDDYKNYLNKAMDKLDAGDCESAKKFYNVYKELSGKTVASVEVLLSDCKKEYYNLGETMQVGDKKYTVAYVRDGGKHGLAILNMGYGKLSADKKTYVTQKGIPTIEELRLLLKNRDNVQLYDRYWSCSRYTGNDKWCAGSGYIYYTIDFSNGQEDTTCETAECAAILLVHRF